MDYAEAVELARQGDERGPEFLYKSTYQSKYYLALKYMKSHEAAEGVLQDAYEKAFTSLDKLANPEAFGDWLGIIVANTAKNVLAKRSPENLSDLLCQDGETEDLELQIGDSNETFQPELAYDKQELSEQVSELVDSLPEDLRTCVLMYYYEGMPVSKIASTLECDAEDVKERLAKAREELGASFNTVADGS